MSRDHVGDLAIVLHSHMPYVEGFGTYPFGEEWLFDAVARSYLPVLEIAERLTMTVTPVLADQLEAEGVPERMERFLRVHRLEAAERDAHRGPAELRLAAEAEAERYRRVLARLSELKGDVVAGFRSAQDEGRVALMTSAATHAVLPLVATAAARRLQIDAGLRSHRRRFGPPAGFWLPECAYVPSLDAFVAERGIRFVCAYEAARGLEPLRPVRTPGGVVAFTIDWPSVELVWSEAGYPSDPAYAEYHRLSMEGIRLWTIEGGAYAPETAERRAREHAEQFVATVATRLRSFASARGAPGLVTFAIDTELLGHWWSEGAEWFRRVLTAAGEHGIELVTLPEAHERHEPEPRPLASSSWGEGKDLRTWDSPEVADLTWAARRLELRLLRALGSGSLSGLRAERAARELLAVQASDWAFLDRKRHAGDYPYRRATDHSRSLLEAIDSRDPPDPRMRNLAPDMSLAPLLEP